MKVAQFTSVDVSDHIMCTGGNADYDMDMHQKEQLHDNASPMMQSQHFSVSDML